MLRSAVIFALLACVAAVLAGNLVPLLNRGESRTTTPAVAPAPAPARVDAAASSDDEGRRVELVADGSGQYSADAWINGSPVRVMVDTGATLVSLSSDVAARIGVFVNDADYTVRVRTANGLARAAPVTLVGVGVGDVYVPQVEALVLERQAGPINLLGMSFLRRLSAVEQRQGMLILRQ